jgi:hypothetical protein
MSKSLIVAFILFLLGVFLLCAPPVAGQEPPPRSNQPKPDIFPCGTVTCEVFNDLTQKVMFTAEVRYRYQVEPGCIERNLGATLQAALVDAKVKLSSSLTFIRDDVNYDLIIRVNCGVKFSAVCGGGAVIGCLGRGFPSNQDVDVTDTMGTFFEISQIAIWLHEVIGHAIGTWNEQYCRIGDLFLACPNWRDVMNVGPESRHLLEEIEIERWHRTMFPPAFERCIFNASKPCVGLDVAGAGIYWCGRSVKANVVSIAYDDGVQGDGYWAASLVGNQLRPPNQCDGVSVQIVADRCYYVLMNNYVSYPTRPWWQLAGCT